MSWLDSLQRPRHLVEAIIHFNQAKDRIDQEASQTEISRCLFDALNKIQTEWVLRTADDTTGEVKAFQTMILEGLEEESRYLFFKSDELKNLVDFKPQIMNHDTLRRHRYRPESKIEPNLIKKATEEHRKLKTAYDDHLMQRKKEVEDRILKRAAELLYVVRSNIAHGEKTPYGPDLKKKVRDEQVSAVVVPLQIMLFNMLLDYPDQKLFIYGTLAPGEPNHPILYGLRGKLSSCTTRGQLNELGGLPVFYWKPDGPNVKGKILVSPDLPERWEEIDKFEGASYKRRLILVDTRTGNHIANVYRGAQC